MKQFFRGFGVSAILILMVWTGLSYHGTVWAQDPGGLSLKLYADKDHPDLKYLLGQEPIVLTMTIRNETGKPIATHRGFSQVELHHCLIIKEPGGTTHVLGEGNEVHKMPPPFFLNERPWGLAELLPAEWIRSVTIDDLTELFSIMKATAGWYSVQARLSFAGLASTGQFAGLGLMGMLEHPQNWEGTINSNILQIYIAPSRGAKLQVQVIEVKNSSAKPLAQLPVRVFKITGPEDFNPNCDMDSDSDVDDTDLSVFAADFGRTGCTNDCEGDFDNDGDVDSSDLSVFAASFGVTGGFVPESAWSNSNPIVTGTSNFEGWVVWDSDFTCLTEDSYAVIARYLENYKMSLIRPGDEEGWGISCKDAIVRKIGFGGSPPDILGDLNGDGCVDLIDYNIIMVDIRGPEPHDPEFDLNEDGAVNIADARYLVALFTNPQGAPCQ
jgi:hypothetical protein